MRKKNQTQLSSGILTAFKYVQRKCIFKGIGILKEF